MKGLVRHIMKLNNLDIKKKKVVVVGGGFVGSLVAKNLEKHMDVTLIDNKDYFEFTPSILKVIVNPENIDNIVVRHEDYLKKTHVVKGFVTEIRNDVVIVGKDHYSYDYLVVATGSRYALPIKIEGKADVVVTANRVKMLKDNHESLVKSKKVLIIGGGLVGVELASEIIDKFPEKEVIIVHSDNRLIPRQMKKSSEVSLKHLEKMGVKVILGEKVIKIRGNVVESDKGTKFQVDKVFLATGIKPNSEALKKNYMNIIDERGFVKVVDDLRIIGSKNVFAAGDLINIKEEKTAQAAENHARIVVKNILLLNSGKIELIKYRPKSKGVVISLGEKNGIFDNGKISFSGFIPAFIKKRIERSFMKKYY